MPLFTSGVAYLSHFLRHFGLLLMYNVILSLYLR